ncbi:hypothetical protein DM02DRAFT_6929 [Periconia macrospinosa]|uniref:Uncharacterized protein n=1 Tax=Periconia macrospinosa TaxID=97972 RepID=A0A2V1EEU6_9PLEO|nr:hypothetical protein DM02DRAFT_6929 [Periconia macrospinosa]
MARRRARLVPGPIGNAETRDTIDLTHTGSPPSVHTSARPRNAPRATHEKIKAEREAEATCLQKILDIFPEISLQYALGLIRKTSRTLSDCEHIIAQILDGGPYPKERDMRDQLKRKRGIEDIGDSHDARPSLG